MSVYTRTHIDNQLYPGYLLNKSLQELKMEEFVESLLAGLRKGWSQVSTSSSVNIEAH